MHDERVGVEDGGEAIERVRRTLACLDQFLKVALDLTFVSRPQDGLDVGVVLVKGRPSDAGEFGYLRHRH